MRSTLYPTKVTIILVSWACRFFWSRGLETTGSGSSRYRMSEHFWHPVAHVQKLQMTLAYVPLGWYSNRTGTSVDDGKAREKDWTRLPVPNLQLCYWSSQLFNLRAPSSFDVPFLLPNQPIIFTWPQNRAGGQLVLSWQKHCQFNTLRYCVSFACKRSANYAHFLQDRRKNPMDFPPSFIKGAWQGFWWAFVTMTTVG